MIRPISQFRPGTYGLDEKVEKAITEMIARQIGQKEKPLIGEIRMLDVQPDKVEHPWLVCDGSLKSVVQYPELFKAIGHQHATESDDTTEKATLFRLPDARGRLLKGTPNTGASIRTGQTVSEVVSLAAGTTLTYLYLTPVIRGA